MKLCSLCMGRLPPFGEMVVSFCDEQGMPRPLTVLFGGGGTGKTTIVSAIAHTRPGHAMSVQSAARGEQPAYAVCEWKLGIDDADRPHPLRVATPMVRVEADDPQEAFRRREQALFDKLARESGYVFVVFPSTRWYSRQGLSLAAPGRTLARYDVRAMAGLDDATRSDLGRETKQALAYAEIYSALSSSSESPNAGRGSFGGAMRRATDIMLSLVGCRYTGLDPASFEPMFVTAEGGRVSFDALPTHARHLISFVALPLRSLWAAYPDRDPMSAEGVVCIDEVELHQEPVVQGQLASALRTALPNVQWIITTCSAFVANGCDQGEVLALRRLPAEARVELFQGAHARLH